MAAFSVHFRSEQTHPKVSTIIKVKKLIYSRGQFLFKWPWDGIFMFQSSVYLLSRPFMQLQAVSKLLSTLKVYKL